MIRDPATAALAHGLLESAGMALGAWLYRRALRRDGEPQPSLLGRGRFAVLVGLLAGAGLGNKLVFWLERPDLVAAWWQHGGVLPMGQSLVGGLLGGLLGVEVAKLMTHQRRSFGDALVLPLAVGIALGRMGCLLAGVHDDTWGQPSTLPWALDAGDGVPRHPAPLYEALFVLSLAAGLHTLRQRLNRQAGLAFKLFLTGYLLWRWGIDGLKPVHAPLALGWSGIQWVCVLALLGYAPFVLQAMRRLSVNTTTQQGG